MHYLPVICCRSDGRTETVARNGSIELNQPTEKQFNSTPDASGQVDCYRKIDDTAEKSVDWRRKLGGMLRDVLDPDNKKHYILKEFPDCYQLYEHVKYTANTGGEGKKKEKGRHAAGTFERQDAYLYGHPDGRKKRFRSPADFFPHLLWLVTDRDGDPLNCSCKLCAPDGDRELTEFTTKEVENNTLDSKQNFNLPQPQPRGMKDTKMDLNSTPPPPPPAPASRSTQNFSASSTAPRATQNFSASSVAPESAMAKPQQPGRPLITKTPEQISDSDPNNKFIYRPGELVWYVAEAVWRLGVVGKRAFVNGEARFLIQPLSNPCTPQSQVIKVAIESLRPWLAWTVPTTTNPILNSLPFEGIPWDKVVYEGLYNNEGIRADYVVDGSILAAKMIDASYTLFNRKENVLAGPGEVHYDGMFIGAEKIWVGEPVRLRWRPNTGFAAGEIVVMVIQKLIERTVDGRSDVTFVGDVYKFVEMPSHYTDRSQWPTPDLPARMVADLLFRNEVAANAGTNMWYEWRLLEPAARKGLMDILGRWYESRALLPILRGGDRFVTEVNNGVVGHIGQMMNGRKENSTLVDRRKKNRKDTLGQSIPEDFKISRGLDSPADDVFPDPAQMYAPPR